MFVHDTFTDTDGTALSAHTGEAGATWAAESGFTIANASIISNRAVSSAVNNLGYASGSPAGTDYTVTGRMRFWTAVANAGVLARSRPGTDVGYSFTYDGGSFKIFKSASTQLGFVTVALSSGADYDMTIDVSGTSTTAIEGRVQRVSDGFWLTSGGTWQSGQTDAISVTDSSSPITSPGKAGVWLVTSDGSSTGAAIDQISASDATSAATTLTLSGPTSGAVGAASTSFTVTPDGTVASDVVTPHTSGSGTFSPTSLTWAASGAAQTFTYTPSTTAGSPHAISITETAGLTIAGSPINYTVNAGPVTVPVTDIGVFFSPYNWRLSGSTYAQTNNPGAYAYLNFTGTSVKLLVDLTPNSSGGESAGNYPAILYRVDTGAWSRYQFASTDTAVSLATGLAAGSHTLEAILVAAWYLDNRWSAPPTSVLRVTGFQIDAGATTSAPAVASGRVLVYWDSQGEGQEALGVGVTIADQDASWSASHLIGRALGEVGVVAFSSQGYLATGSGNVPALSGAWNHYDSANSRLVSSLLSPAPDWIFSFHGQNDAGQTDAAVTAAVQSQITAWRAAAPSAKIAICAGPNLAKASAIQTAVTNAADAKCKIITTGTNYLGAQSGAGTFNNDVHLSHRGHANYAAAIIAQAETAFATGGGGGGGGGSSDSQTLTFGAFFA